MSKSVTLVEMGLRDGLQNESNILNVEERVEFARRLCDAGLKRIEIGAFVSPKWVPQMENSSEVVKKVLLLQKEKTISKKTLFSTLVPNEIGMKDALNSGIKEIGLFTAASDSFAKKNINCSVDESMRRFEAVAHMAKKNKIRMRGYISTAFYCPFEGKVSSKKVIILVKQFKKMGCFEISIGDTIGAATPGEVHELFKDLKKVISIKNIAGHFHDTRGMALANILESYKMGVRVFDTSVGGLGGCPYAPGATGNVATEDVVYMFNGMKVKTNIQLDKLISLNPWISEKVGRSLPSRVGKVGMLIPKGKVI